MSHLNGRIIRLEQEYGRQQASQRAAYQSIAFDQWDAERQMPLPGVIVLPGVNKLYIDISPDDWDEPEKGNKS